MNNNQVLDDLINSLGVEAQASSSSLLGSAFYGFSSTAVPAANISQSSSVLLSEVEQAILRSNSPIKVNETEELTVLGQRGVWVNKAEVNAWRGDLPITEYRIHEDMNPQIITKRIKQEIEYVQELAVRYLRPPTPPTPGEIIITQEANVNTEPAPPLIIRQQPPRAPTPEPLVIREAPPQPPAPVGPKRITISGKRNPPPPRKVVIERLAPLPSKPQNVIIERWLPYTARKRRVIFNKSTEVNAEVAKPRNIIVQWESPAVNIRRDIKYLGVIKANPAEYVQKYGASLKPPETLPKFVTDIETPNDVGVLAADFRPKSVLELEGQLEGFRLVNLDNEGLGEYRDQLLKAGIRDLGSEVGIGSSSTIQSSANSISDNSTVAHAAAQIFTMIDTENSGTITVEEAEAIVLRLNTKLNKSYSEDEVKRFFRIVSKGSSKITRDQFLKAFRRLAA